MSFNEFVVPAVRGLSEKDARRVAVAIDCAIAYGAIQYAKDRTQNVGFVKETYEKTLRKLLSMLD